VPGRGTPAKKRSKFIEKPRDVSGRRLQKGRAVDELDKHKLSDRSKTAKDSQRGNIVQARRGKKGGKKQRRSRGIIPKTTRLSIRGQKTIISLGPHSGMQRNSGGDDRKKKKG